MSSIAVIEATVDTQTSTGTGDSDFVDVVTTENLVEGKVYHVICTASVEAPDSTQLFEWRLYDETNSTVLGDSTTKREMTQSGKPQTYYYVGRFTAGSTTGGLAFQQKGYSSASEFGYDPAKTNFLTMLLLDMSAMDSGNFFFETQQDNSQVQAGFTDRVTHTASDVEEDDTWLVFAWTMYYINNVAHSIITRLACDDEDTTDPSILFEGEDTEEELGWWWCRSFVLSGDNATVEWKIEDKRETSGGGAHYCKRTTLFGIKLSSIPDYFVNYSTSGRSPTDTNFFELGENDFTPNNTGKVVVVACSTVDMGGSYRQASMRIQEKGTTIPNVQPNHEDFINTNDATDILPLSYVTVYDGVSGSSSQIDYDVRSSVGTIDVVFADRTLAIFGTTLTVPPVTFSAVAKQVYNSGDVASETFDAGSKATQGFASGDVEGQGFASGDTAAQSHSGGDVEAEARP